MPIQLLYTDSEILKIQSSLLRKLILELEDLSLLEEINNYLKS
jgi:hypothetical protein